MECREGEEDPQWAQGWCTNSATAGIYPAEIYQAVSMTLTVSVEFWDKCYGQVCVVVILDNLAFPAYTLMYIGLLGIYDYF